MLALLAIAIAVLNVGSAHPLDTTEVVLSLTSTSVIFGNVSTATLSTSTSSSKPTLPTASTPSETIEPPPTSGNSGPVTGIALPTALVGTVGLLILALILWRYRRRKKARLATSTSGLIRPAPGQVWSGEKRGRRTDPQPLDSDASASGIAPEVRKQEMTRPLRPSTTM